MCLVNDGVPTPVIMSAVRKSLRSPAADVLIRMGDSVTLEDVLAKFHSLYGRVASTDELLKQFYGGRQESKEACSEWACRLEDYMYGAIEQDPASGVALKRALAQRFWSGIRDVRIKDAMRNRSLNFEEMLLESRKLEEEFGDTGDRKTLPTSGRVNMNQTEPKDDMLGTLLEKLMQLEKKIEAMQTQQQQSQAPRLKPLNCFKCQKQGHLAYGCRDGTNIQCFRCKEIGHIQASCLNG